ncbi:fatty acid synthase-like [Phlebotomus argentipes]|uniref:fatty acid synthase-like n=1 Tax=Phlebotomus argentipes TaxID=94469 RepID=UPI0028932E04|nr:fatty acid synthase-like [Phlebotomus argentipes]
MVNGREPKDLSCRTQANCPEDEIVISGISGQFPKSPSMLEFAKNLYAKADLLDEMDPQWKESFPELPEKFGLNRNVTYFDAPFFGVHYKQAHLMDPSTRYILECSYETIIDAGINPMTLRGSNTGVFIGSTFLDMDKIFYNDKLVGGGFAITGCNRAMMANRVSYIFDLQGISAHVDSLSNATLNTLNVAYSAIRNGQCEAAIVGGSNVILHPFVTAQLAQMGALSKDGVTRTFDEGISGTTNSEANCCIFLQKAKHAKRVYARLVHSKSSHSGYIDEGITTPSVKMQVKLLETFYREISLDPADVAYVEAHCEGLLKYDAVEVAALDAVMCRARKTPLKVGCVKSNIGNTQPCGGICGIAKVIIGMENGAIPPNINFSRPHPELKALVEGRMQVVTEAEEFRGRNFAAVNSVSFAGGISHVLLESVAKEKLNNGLPADDLPRLISWAGRTEEGVHEMFKFMASHPLDAEFVGLVHETQTETVSNNIFRGFGVFQKDADGGNAVVLEQSVQHFPGVKRPVVWLFSGMGSQWPQMGSSLMSIPIFRRSVERSHEVLLAKGVDLIGLLTSDDPETFDNILNSFVGIAAVQIAIVDVLRALQIQPDIIIGHSVGELGCAYADGCFTAEEMILSAYSRGKVSVETKKIFGSMAAVGLGYSSVRKMLPPDVEVACRNSSTSSTISGPAASVEAFVADLKNQGVFAKEVPCSNIAYHSRYIADMGPKLLELLTEVVRKPKRRSAKWLSTSVPQPKWEDEENQLSSAQYHTNNLLNPVLFEDTFAMIPNNALTIEIAPHGLLQAIVKRSKAQAVHIPLTQRGNKNNTNFFLAALGKIYMNGIDFPIQNLYPAIEFPVSKGTPMISPHIRWDHSTEWYIPSINYGYEFKPGRHTMDINPESQEYNFLLDHIIDDKLLYPVSGFIRTVWETFALSKEKNFYEMSVEFSQIKVLQHFDLTINKHREVVVVIQPGTGYFQVCEENSAILSGNIKILEEESSEDYLVEDSSSDCIVLKSKDFYTELYLRGYEYKGAFQSVAEARSDGSGGKVRFENNWMAFLDSFVQIFAFGRDTRDLMLPKSIQAIRIRPQEVLRVAEENRGLHQVKVCAELKTISSPGLEIVDLRMKTLRKNQPTGKPVSESFRFIPHLPAPQLSIANAARVCVQSLLDNHRSSKVKIVEVDSVESSHEILPNFRDAVEDLPGIRGTLILLSSKKATLDGIHVEAGELNTQKNCDIVIKKQFFRNGTFPEGSLESLADGGYLISREEKSIELKSVATSADLSLIFFLPVENETLVVFKRSSRKILPSTSVFEASQFSVSEEWLKNVKEAAKLGSVTLMSSKDSNPGISGLANLVRKKIPGQSINFFSVEDKKFSDASFQNQVKLTLASNVFRNGQWGSFRWLRLSDRAPLEAYTGNCFVEFTSPENALEWRSGSVLGATQGNLVNVMFCGLNLRDKEIVSGELPLEETGLSRRHCALALGSEFAGVDQEGRRVMGVVPHGALSSQALADDAFTFPVPEHWTLEEAATVPMAYLTVYWALFFKANILAPLKHGRRILIHCGADELGIAAIRVSLAYGLDVFTTVDSIEKKEFLLSMFSELKEDQIGSTTDLSFERMVKEKCKPRVCNYVFNTLKGAQLAASARCLDLGGKFLQMGKWDMIENNDLGLYIFIQEVEFQAVQIEAVFGEECEMRQDIIKLIQADIKKGVIQPIPATVFNANDVNEAFGYYSSKEHIGKVVLRLREHKTDKSTLPIPISPRFSAQAESSFVIFGGLDDFGLEFVDWLIVRGARKVVLTSLGKSLSDYQLYRMRLWQSYGAQVVHKLESRGSRSECLELLDLARKLGPISGIFSASLCSSWNGDELFEASAAEVSVSSAKNFDELSRKLCPNLAQFVVFSRRWLNSEDVEQCRAELSIAMAEKIVQERAAQGFPGKVIHLGSLEGQKPEQGVLSQKIFSCLTEVDKLMLNNEIIVAHRILDKTTPKKFCVLNTIKEALKLKEITSLDETMRDLAHEIDDVLNLKKQIRKEYDISLTVFQLRRMTSRELLAIVKERARENEGELILTNDKKPKGLEMLLQFLKDRNSSAQQKICRMPSHDRTAKYNSCVVLIPGLVDILDVDLREISLNIALPVFSLRVTEDIGLLSVADLARSLLPVIKRDALKMSQMFYLVGYSFGVFLTLELARLLEQEGMTGQVLLIDGAPEFFRLLLAEQLGDNFAEEDVEELIVENILRVVFPEENPREVWGQRKARNWRERVQQLAEACKNQFVYSEEHLMYIAELLRRRLRGVRAGNAEMVDPVESPITLVRPTDVSVADIERDYGMAQWTKGKFHLRFIDGDHASMLRNRSLARIINEFDPRLKDNREFEDYVGI